jgi:hypothetical protein
MQDGEKSEFVGKDNRFFRGCQNDSVQARFLGGAAGAMDVFLEHIFYTAGLFSR